jgi:membrane protein
VGSRRAADRILAGLAPIVGSRRVRMARRVLDRLGAADGGLLAAGVAYNAVLALIPLGLLASGLAGFVLTDAGSRADVVRAIAGLVPPLSGVVDEIVAGLSRASPSLSIVGLVLAGWGTTRLFASLESAIVQIEARPVRRGLMRRTARRVGSLAIVALVLLAALVAAPALAIGVEMAGTAGVNRPLLDILLALVPPTLAALALAAIYRLIPVTRPSWRDIVLPAVVGSAALVIVTRVFVFLTPRVFGANVVYGTLGAILVGLAWLDLVFAVVLAGAAWVIERRPLAVVDVATAETAVSMDQPA